MQSLVHQMLNRDINTRPGSAEIFDWTTRMETTFQLTCYGLSPVQSNASGFYRPLNWVGDDWMRPVPSKEFMLPPLVVNKEIMDNVAIFIYGKRKWENDIHIYGGFHSKVPASVSAINVQLDISITFTEIGETKWTVRKQIIATIQHGNKKEFWWPELFRLYDVPFTSLSLSPGPVATNISIKRISPDQKWFYWGLAPLFDQNGEFDTIDCNLLNGSYECAKEWAKMRNHFAFARLCLPPLVLTSEILPFLPLVLNEVIIDEVAIVIDGDRSENEFWVSGRFHPNVPENVLQWNVEIKLTITFMKEDNTSWSVDKHVIATIGCGGSFWIYDDRLITLYDVPFDSLSSLSAPVLTNFFIRRISPEQKWYWMGLPPKSCQDGKFDTIDCNYLNGVFDGAKEWQNMAKCPLPPLILPTDSLGNLVVCMHVQHLGKELQFFAKLHPSTPETVQFHEMLFKIDVQWTSRDNSILTRHAEETFTLKRDDMKLFNFNDLFWDDLYLSSPPLVTLSILSTN